MKSTIDLIKSLAPDHQVEVIRFDAPQSPFLSIYLSNEKGESVRHVDAFDPALSGIDYEVYYALLVEGMKEEIENENETVVST